MHSTAIADQTTQTLEEPALARMLCAPRARTVITRRVDFRVGRNWISQLKYRRAADGSCGLLSPPADPAALGSGIIRLLGDGALRARFGAAGRTRAAAFSVERTARHTALVYKRVNAIGA